MTRLRFSTVTLQILILSFLIIIGMLGHSSIVLAGGGGSGSGGNGVGSSGDTGGSNRDNYGGGCCGSIASGNFSTDKTETDVAASVMNETAPAGVTYGSVSTYSSSGGWGYSVGQNAVTHGDGNNGSGNTTGGRTVVYGPGAATGNFDSVSPDSCSVAGWAYDPDNQNTSISVDVYRDHPAGRGGVFVTRCTADASRPDVNSSVHITGNHGFSCVLPDSYMNSGNHALYIHAIDINGTPNNLINGSGKTLQCGPTDNRPLGDIYETLGFEYKGPNTACQAIAGWSCDTDFPDNPVRIYMNVDGKYYSSFTTSIPYPWLMAPAWAPANGIACGLSKNALWGFSYPTPLALKDGQPHTVTLFAANQGPKGSALNTQLPHELAKLGLTIPLQCPVPGLLYNLSAGLINPGDRVSGVPFTIVTKANNIGRATTKADFYLKVQIDKKNGTDPSGWWYQGNGVGGDVMLQTLIPAGLLVGSTTAHNFVTALPAGDYRIRAIADPDYWVEASTSSQLADNTTLWSYFTVGENPTGPSGTPDLSFQSFGVTSACDASAMLTLPGQVCPSTKVALVLQNNGDGAIAPGAPVPYRVEYQLPNAAWTSLGDAIYRGGLAQSGGTSNPITVSVPNLPFGTSQIRATVNPTHLFGETNFTDNVRLVTQTYQLAATKIDLGVESSVIRYGSTAKLTWTAITVYPLSCVVTGNFPNGKTATFTISPNVHAGTLPASSPLTSTQKFTVSCSPSAGGVAGAPTSAITQTAIVEVIPLVQEN